jgi:two-component system sensor histidine kinase/response regulator
MTEGIPTFDLLLVDDNPMNLGVLSEILRAEGYRVRIALTGRKALEAVRLQQPDLVLMDITMPEMDGYEACAALKAAPALAGIPVVFLSAHDDPVDKVRAFAVGGADYVQKPFHAKEVLARVAHHLRIANLQATLEIRNRELQESNAKLAELDRVKSKFAAMLVHDLRNPLTAVGGFLDMLELLPPAEQLAALPAKHQRCHEQLDRCLAFLEDLLLVYRADAKGLEFHPQPIELPSFLQRLVESHRGLALKARIALELEVSAALPPFLGDSIQLGRMLDNLLSNALKFTDPEGRILLQVDQAPGKGVDEGRSWIRLRVSDSGRGIPAEQLPFVFDPYHQALARDSARGSGLGLSIVARIVAAHHGRVTVQSQVGMGTTFTIHLPG